MKNSNCRVLALDMEGTLISNAMSAFPRPGLFVFLEFCHDAFERVVLFTTIREERIRPICKLLAEEGSAPAWFADIEYIDWEPMVNGVAQQKDLNLIPNAEPEHSLLVDDIGAYVVPDQIAQWVEIRTWGSDDRYELERSGEAYPSDDVELERVSTALKKRLIM